MGRIADGMSLPSARPAPRAPRACPYCSGRHASPAGCDTWYAAKAASTKASYRSDDGSLMDVDVSGFAASGVLPWRVREGEVEFLFALERRKGAESHNFIGGKRDFFRETPADTARRELREELMGLLEVDLSTPLAVLWMAPSRYVLHVPLAPVPEETAAELIDRWMRSEERPNDGNMRSISWISLSTLLSPKTIRRVFHAYMRADLEVLRATGVYRDVQRAANIQAQARLASTAFFELRAVAPFFQACARVEERVLDDALRASLSQAVGTALRSAGLPEAARQVEASYKLPALAAPTTAAPAAPAAAPAAPAAAAPATPTAPRAASRRRRRRARGHEGSAAAGRPDPGIARTMSGDL